MELRGNNMRGVSVSLTGFEHLQLAESSVELLKPDDLPADMTSLKTRCGKYAKRTVSVVVG